MAPFSPALAKLAGGVSPRRKKPGPPPRWTRLLYSITSFHHTGWLDNHHHKRAVEAEQRKELHAMDDVMDTADDLDGIDDTEPRSRKESLANALQAAETKTRRQYKEFIQTVDRSANAADEEAQAEDEDSDATKDANETVPGGPAIRRKAKKRRKLDRDLLPEPAIPNENEANWVEAHKLVREGVANARIPKDQTTDRAYTNPIPELEGVGADGKKFELRDHQREALGWWLYMVEKHKCFLFSDDMGLGKTAVAVARMMLAILKAAESGEQARFMVVVPLSLLTMWEIEIRRCPSIKLCVYHSGPERTYSRAKLETYDVILTTYDTLKNQYVLLKKVQLDFTNTRDGYKPWLERRLRKLQKSRSGYRNSEPDKLHTKRVAVPLLSIEFDEIIVDEAHTIRNKDCVSGHALFHVKAKGRICITGTPIQNNFWDVFSLLRFFRLKPFNSEKFFKLCFIDKSKKSKPYWTRGVNADAELVLASVLSAIQLRRLKSGNFNGSEITGILQPIEVHYTIRLNATAQKQQMSTYTLWDAAARIRKARESKAANSHEAQDKLFETAVDQAKSSALIRKEKMQIFKRIHEAKANAYHQWLLDAKYSDEGFIELEGTQELQHWVAEMLGDGHDEASTAQNPPPAAELKARHKAQWEKNRKEFMARVDSTPTAWESDKLIMVVEAITDILKKVDVQARKLGTAEAQKEYRTRNKILIFTEYLAAADILKIAVKKKLGITCLEYNGQCSKEDRVKIEAQFEEQGKDFSQGDVQPDEQVIMLATIKSAGEGLTFVHATHVMFPAPCWNPYVEEQALGRAYRMGQKGQIFIYRFRMKESIEGRMDDVCAVKRDRVASVQDHDKLVLGLNRIDQWSVQRMKQTLEKGAGKADKAGLIDVWKTEQELEDEAKAAQEAGEQTESEQEVDEDDGEMTSYASQSVKKRKRGGHASSSKQKKRWFEVKSDDDGAATTAERTHDDGWGGVEEADDENLDLTLRR